MKRLALLWLACALPLGAQGWEGDQTTVSIPATGASRQSDFSLNLIGKAPVERLKAQTVKEGGVTVNVTLVKPGEGENQLWELRWEPGEAWAAGTWVAFRDGLGELREARIILREGNTGTDNRLAQPGTWIRLVPQGKGRGCRLDVFLAGRLVTGGWSVAAPLFDILQSDDGWLWEKTKQDIDWAALIPQHRWEDEKVEALRARMHKVLSVVPASKLTLWWPDPKSGPGATAANGSPWGTWMLLPGQEGETKRGLGPWGVTLWTATGVLKGWKAPFVTWEALLEQRIELPGYSRALVPDDLTADPAFALDWIRNLGLETHRALYPARPRSDDSADVKDLPFLTPVPAAGYSVDDFAALANLLAVSRPGTVYLASLSVQQVEKGKSSAVTYLPPAVILPWVGSDHRVRVAVYAGPQEQTWEQWLNSLVPAGRKGNRPDHIALTALPLPTTVDLPLLPAR